MKAAIRIGPVDAAAATIAAPAANAARLWARALARSASPMPIAAAPTRTGEDRMCERTLCSDVACSNGGHQLDAAEVPERIHLGRLLDEHQQRQRQHHECQRLEQTAHVLEVLQEDAQQEVAAQGGPKQAAAEQPAVVGVEGARAEQQRSPEQHRAIDATQAVGQALAAHPHAHEAGGDDEVQHGEVRAGHLPLLGTRHVQDRQQQRQRRPAPRQGYLQQRGEHAEGESYVVHWRIRTGPAASSSGTRTSRRIMRRTSAASAGASRSRLSRPAMPHMARLSRRCSAAAACGAPAAAASSSPNTKPANSPAASTPSGARRARFTHLPSMNAGW